MAHRHMWVRSSGGARIRRGGGGAPNSERWGGPINVEKWWLIFLPFFGVPSVSVYCTNKGVTLISPLSEELMCYIPQHSELFCLLGGHERYHISRRYGQFSNNDKIGTVVP